MAGGFTFGNPGYVGLLATGRIVFDPVYNTSVNGTTHTSIAGGTFAGRGAGSKQAANSGSGLRMRLEYVMVASSAYDYFGLYDATRTALSGTPFPDFGFEVLTDGSLYVFDAGQEKATGAACTPGVSVLALELWDSGVKWFRDGTLIFSSPTPASAAAYYPVFLIYAQGGAFRDARLTGALSARTAAVS